MGGGGLVGVGRGAVSVLTNYDCTFVCANDSGTLRATES